MGERSTQERLASVVEKCQFMDYTLHVKVSKTGMFYLQATYEEPDINTGEVETQYTRRWPLSPLATKSEIVQTCFKCCITSMEHRTREHFLYKGRRVFGPHFDVDALWGICDQIDEREKAPDDI